MNKWTRAQPTTPGWYWYADDDLVSLGFDLAKGLVPKLGYLRQVNYEDTSWWEFGGQTMFSGVFDGGYWCPAEVNVPSEPDHDPI